LNSKNKDRITLKAKIRHNPHPKIFTLSASLIPTIQSEYANTDAPRKIRIFNITRASTGLHKR